MKLQYHTKSHSKYLIKYHLIIVCKYRKKLLQGIIDDDIKNIIFDISKMEDTKFDIEVMKTDNDHMHILIDCEPSISATSIVSRVKQISTIRIWKLHKEELLKHFWVENTFWSDGYFVCSIGEALSNIPDSGINLYKEPENSFQKLMSKDNKTNKIENHEKIEHKELILKRMSSIPQGGNRQDIPIELGQGGGKHSNNYRRLDEKKPSITLKHATKSMIVHPRYNRGLTPREVARLQSFSDDFILKGSKFEQHQQLANAVPPLLGKAIAKSVKLYLNNHENE